MKKTYCLQVGTYFTTTNDHEIKKLKHMIDCKPFTWNKESMLYECKCKKYKFTGDAIIALIQKGMVEGQLFMRLD